MTHPHRGRRLTDHDKGFNSISSSSTAWASAAHHSVDDGIAAILSCVRKFQQDHSGFQNDYESCQQIVLCPTAMSSHLIKDNAPQHGNVSSYMPSGIGKSTSDFGSLAPHQDDDR